MKVFPYFKWNLKLNKHNDIWTSLRANKAEVDMYIRLGRHSGQFSQMERFLGRVFFIQLPLFEGKEQKKKIVKSPWDILGGDLSIT
jgi:aminoglycoside phosphotransferase family enzyme